MLAQAARMDFAFARHVQQRALESDDAKELAELARAYARLSRSMRQNFALLTKQKADREKAKRERKAHEGRQRLLRPEPQPRKLPPPTTSTRTPADAAPGAKRPYCEPRIAR